MSPRGLFLGTITLDLVYASDGPPEPNEKKLADDLLLAAGGPAANAAVTFAHLGGRACVAGVLGQHPLVPLIRADLEACGVEVLDLAPQHTGLPPLSSIVVSTETGDRAVMARPPDPAAPAQLGALRAELDRADVLLFDGYQLAAAGELLDRATALPTVVDAGSWRPGYAELLPRTGYVICSDDFRPPGCTSAAEVLDVLADAGVRQAAVSRGGAPILVQDRRGRGEIPVPAVAVRDTLAAGDVLHGAFCRFILEADFRSALARAAAVAAHACRFFGTRAWRAHWPPA